MLHAGDTKMIKTQLAALRELSSGKEKHKTKSSVSLII